MGLAYLFITHDLRVARWIADRVLVMYLGAIVESGTSAEIFAHPKHPYTQALLAALPGSPSPWRRAIGDIPSAFRMPTGCRFRTRCAYAERVCQAEEPRLREVSPNHHVACHLVDPSVRVDACGAP